MNNKSIISIILSVFFTLTFFYAAYGSVEPSQESSYTFDVNSAAAFPEIIKDPLGNSYLLYSFVGQNSFTAETGKPKLPVLIKRVAIPADAVGITVEVVNSMGREENITYPIYPVEKEVVKQNLDGSRYVDKEFFKNGDFYNNFKGFYPTEKVKIEEAAEFRGLKYVVLAIYPLQYDPQNKLLHKDNSIDIKVSWQSSSNQISAPNLGKTFNKTLQSLDLLNFGQNQLTADNQNNELLTNGVVSRPTDLLAGVPTDYLIITADDFYNSSNIDTLANHRASVEGGGYNVAIVKTSDIYNTAFPDKTGSETVDKLIKIFIKRAYDYWNRPNPKLAFVLLVGDAVTNSDNTQQNASNLVPVHISTILNYGEYPATDFWYSCLNGTLPADYLSDTYDTFGDIAIGRFPVKTETELGRIIAKTINYEMVFPNTPGDWKTQASLFSGFSVNDWYGIDINHTLFNNLQNKYFSPWGINSTQLFRNDFANDVYGLYDFNAHFLSNFNQGQVMMEVSTHGSKITWSDGTPGQRIFGTQDIGNLTNSDKLPMIFTTSCDTAWFDDPVFESLGESLLESSDNGAVSYLGASRVISMNSIRYEEYVFQEIFNNYDAILGSAVLASKNYAFQPVDRLLKNLLGDPALNFSGIITRFKSPDLTCSLLSYQISGSNVTFHTKVNNSGYNDASNVLIELYNGDPNNGGTIISAATQQVSLVQSKQEISLDITIPLQANWIAGYSTFLYLEVDGLGQIPELNENNNVSAPIYFYILGFEDKVIATGKYPVIYGNKIVYQDDRNGNTDIYMYDLGRDGKYDPLHPDSGEGEYHITSNPGSHQTPALYATKIVYVSNQSGNDNIYMYDLGADGIFNPNNPDAGEGEYCITNNPASQDSPAIYGNNIVWRDARNGTSNYDIYLYNLGVDGRFDIIDEGQGEFPVVTSSSNQQDPAINGNKIAWSDRRNSSTSDDIYLYDLGADGRIDTVDSYQGEYRITSTSESQRYPKIYDNKIVWEHNSPYTKYDVHMYNLGLDGRFGTGDTGERISVVKANSLNQRFPNIYGNTITWQEVWNSFYDIFKYDLGPNGQFGDSDDGGEAVLTKDPAVTNRGNSSVYGSKVVYHGTVGGIYKIFLIDTNPSPILYPIGSKMILAGEQLEFTITASDGNNDPLQISASNLPEGAVFTSNGSTAAFSWTPTLDQVGIFPGVHFEVSDGNTTTSEDITITVSQPNRPPVLNPIDNQIVNEGEEFSMTISAADPDGDILSLNGSRLPSGASFIDNRDNTATLSWAPAYDQAGIYSDIYFNASDGQLIDEEYITITVTNTNRAPVLNPIANQVVYQGSLLTFSISGSDPDNDPLQLTATNLPSGAAFVDNDNGTGTFSWTPTYLQVGPYNIIFEVSDGFLTDQEAITITVNKRSKDVKRIEQH